MTREEGIQTDCLYDLNDMVRADCHDCEGCSDCCRGMGDTILLDPYDCWLLTKNLGKTFDELVQQELALGVKDGLILPHLKMEENSKACTFLNEEGRCSIHAFRPGICRLFPLGRQYTENSVKYFLVPDECKKENRSKVKVKKWLDTPELKRNQQFLFQWHEFKKQLMAAMMEEADEQMAKNLNLFVLNHFYRKPYETDDFYAEFDRRLTQAKEALGMFP